ncbi:MAG: metalloregulator ArsR/SmtB family transcription factor [Pseudomonadota bacterium]
MANELAPDLNAIFHALADPKRRQVIRALTAGPADVSALAAPFDLALPTFLKHLKVLEDAGLVVTQKRGRIRHCALRPEALTAAERWIGEHALRWDAKLDGLEKYLAHQSARKDRTR